MRVSVVTPTIYNDRLELPKQALANQTFKDFEWLICSRIDPKIEGATWIPDTFKDGFWGLNRAYNALFRAAKGEIIVTLQDNIWVLPNGLEKFVAAVQETGGFVSGVGDQYGRIGQYGKPEVKVWNDPRKTDRNGTFYECFANDIEWNWAAFPREAVFEVGGMDEGLDFLGYGGDQLQLMERVEEAGYKCYLDQTNESFTLRHSRVKGWDKNHVIFNGKYDKRKEELKEKGEWPHLHFLEKSASM